MSSNSADQNSADQSSADQIAIRRLILAELPAFKELRDAMLAEHPEAFTSDAATARLQPSQSYVTRLGFDRPEGGEFTLGAWQGSRMVGCIGCQREGRVKVRHIGHVVGMMVRSELQGRGIGRGLLTECIALARQADGLNMLTLTVTAGNDAAVRLYERAGFVRYGSLPRAIYVEGRYYAKDEMVLQLDH
jgi:ribosomal protein S18 acetylase RimI-like enzyme